MSQLDPCWYQRYKEGVEGQSHHLSMMLFLIPPKLTHVCMVQQTSNWWCNAIWGCTHITQCPRGDVQCYHLLHRGRGGGQVKCYITNTDQQSPTMAGFSMDIQWIISLAVWSLELQTPDCRPMSNDRYISVIGLGRNWSFNNDLVLLQVWVVIDS